jgi:hypothetical protein
MKQSLGLIYSWLHNMTGHNAADEMEVNIKTAYDYYGFCRGRYFRSFSETLLLCTQDMANKV